MKKIYVLVVAMLTASLFNAQKTASSPADLLYFQDMTGNGSTVIPADGLSNGSAIYGTDDFTLSSNASVSSILVLGVQSNENLASVATGAQLYIYADNGGKPSGIPGDGTATIATIDLPSSSAAYELVSGSTGVYQFSIDVTTALGAPLSLTAGTTYWLVFAPKTNLTTFDPASLWFWYTGTANGNPAKMVDPTDIYGAGLIDWTDLSTLAGGDAAYNGLAFAIEGTTTLGTSEVYSSIKDVTVAKDKSGQELFVYLKNQTLKSVEVYSVDGRKVTTSATTKVDISSLKSGVYVVKVIATDGSVKSTKFVK